MLDYYISANGLAAVVQDRVTFLGGKQYGILAKELGVIY
jgi:hypothetical protein